MVLDRDAENGKLRKYNGDLKSEIQLLKATLEREKADHARCLAT